LETYRAGIPYIEISPNGLKKFVTGKGSGKKEVIMLEAYKRWGIEGTNDEVDAYCLAMVGLAYHGHITMPKVNMEALKKCTLTTSYAPE
jgi:Holliday junction resolvasome RuvABC endonuclease subunit